MEWNTNDAFSCIKERKMKIYVHIGIQYTHVYIMYIYIHFLHFNMNSIIICVLYNII